jgi:ABC-2 type transport system permease protein
MSNIMAGILPAFSLWQREMVRFVRQRDRIIGALGTPVVFWLLLGSGLGRSFQTAQGQGYLEYFFAGTLVMILLFTAIFSTISVIEDRREGFLQAVLVAPVGRTALVFGKLLGGTALAVLQGLLFLAMAPLTGITLNPAGLLWLVITMLVLSFALTGLGFLLAWRMNSTQGFHAIMNLFLIPMWLLSGAVFPSSGAPAWMGWVMKLNPLTYGVTAIREGLYWPGMAAVNVPAFVVTMIFAATMLGLSLAATRRVIQSDLL